MLQKGVPRQQGRLHNDNGIPVGSEQRAETFAKYLSEVQWKVRPAAVVNSRPAIREEIPIDTAPFRVDELVKVLKRLKREKSAGIDAIPPEYYKAALSDTRALNEILNFCNQCWRRKSIPKSWQTARVREIFKKGDP